jgi:NAD(P)-dependent dehydrogenase (short-subunit alcohol dehydrogenase family)
VTRRRAALITGASSGIGLAIAEMLGEEGYALTVAARRPDKLTAAADGLRARGYAVQEYAGNLGDEAEIDAVVAAHRQAYGRLDVLVNNAGVGFGGPVDDVVTKAMDLQIGINLRAIVLFYRAAMPMLREAGAEHRNALVVNTSSITGKGGQPLLGVYSATKHGVVGFTEAMNKELADAGIKSTALCPAFVDTPMMEHVEGAAPAEELITTADVAESVRFLIRTSPGCVVPEIQFTAPGGGDLLPDAGAAH